MSVLSRRTYFLPMVALLLAPLLSACHSQTNQNSVNASHTAQARVVTLPTLPNAAMTGGAAMGSNLSGVTVNQASPGSVAMPPGSAVNISYSFSVGMAIPGDYAVFIHFLDQNGNVAFQGDYAPSPSTSTWSGLVTNVRAVTAPSTAGTYYIMLGLYNAAGRAQMTAGQGVQQDNQFRYYVGTIVVDPNAPKPNPLPPASLDLTGYTLTFDDEFTAMNISGTNGDGVRWHVDTNPCCMTSSDGSGAYLYPEIPAGATSSVNPFSLIPGGGLNIALQKSGKNWFGGEISSVDYSGKGFAQQYGYFEMKAKFPKGLGTWPGFWLLDAASKNGAQTAGHGEIDIIEQYGVSDTTYGITLHDWSANKIVGSQTVATPDLTDGYHTYGMKWTESQMSFYCDGALVYQTATPAVMKQPYYILVDMGMGAGWDTSQTPNPSVMQVAYVRAYQYTGSGSAPNPDPTPTPDPDPTPTPTPSGATMQMVNPATISAVAGQPFSLTANMSVVPMASEGYNYCVHYLNSSNHMVGYDTLYASKTSTTLNGQVAINAKSTLSNVPDGAYKISASYCRFNGSSFDHAPMAAGSGVTVSPEAEPGFFIVGTVKIGNVASNPPPPSDPPPTSDPTPSGPTMQMVNPASITASAGQAFSMTANMSVVPMANEAYNYCIHYLNSSNQLVGYDTFYASQPSTSLSGQVSIASKSKLSNVANGVYKISASYCRFNGSTFDHAPMAAGAGVTVSPEAEPGFFIVGTLNISN